MRDGEVRERGDVVLGVAELSLDLGELPAEHGRDDVELVAHVIGRQGVDRADRGGDHLCGALGDLRQDVAQEVHAAALLAADHDGGDRGLQARVRGGDHQLRAMQAAGLQRAQERGPERDILAVTDGEAQGLPASVRADAGRHDDALGGDAGPLPPPMRALQ